MKILNKGVSLLIVLTLLFSGMSFAVSEPLSFDDVANDSWYYEGVMTMAEYGVITGYPDGTFRPQNEVSREEFAVMMVRALQLGKSGSDSSFEDVDDDYWAVPYIEAAKKYLTGYKTNTGISFKPKYDAVREDMAVALVKALNYNVNNANLKVLNKFEDKELISENLKAYVAMAYEKRLIKGSQEEDGLYFNPTKTLTRAEAAVLLLAVIREEKITFDEEKVVIEDAEYTATKLKVEVEDDVAYLKWDKIKHEDFKGYKVVVSKYDSTPSYPDNGYVRYFTDDDITRFQIKEGQRASGSDFVKVEAGQRYYATITTLFKDGKKTSNVVSFKLNKQAEPTYIRPSLKIEHDEDEAKLFWTEINHPNFKYYKVVVSEKDKTPKYPDNGYMYAISNSDNNDVEIEVGDKGNHSDFYKIESGKSYYVSVSAVYKDRVLTSNVVGMSLTDDEDHDEYITPTLTIADKGDSVLLDWNKVDHSEFKGYKVVVSKSDDSPVYPDNGYMKYITDKDNTAFEIKVGDKAYNADFVKIEKDQWYYAAITVLYDDDKVVTNTVKFKIDQEVSDDYITPNLVVRENGTTVELDWNRIDHTEFQGYKVVVSEGNEAPKYPADGYMKYITDKDVTTFDISKGMKAYNADFNGIEYDKEYYASITVLYKNGKTYSNTVVFELEEEERNYIEPTLDLRIDEEEQLAHLSWTRIDHPDFQGYKVVVSATDDSPEYPSNGYVTYITDKNQSEFDLAVGTKGYNTDFYKIEENEKYYVAITAVYSDDKVTGNVEDFEFEFEEEEEEVEDLVEELVKPVLEIESLTSGSVAFNWGMIDHEEFEGYKLVISKDNESPSYPDDGYMTYITDEETTHFDVNIGDAPQRGDFETIEENVTYYATITALYGEDKLTSDSVSFTLTE
jgi:hypothetical protein